MEAIIKNHPATTLIGKSLAMTFAQNKTAELWQSFMQHRNEISNRLGEELYSVQVYSEGFDFSPNTPFTKWATVPVSGNTTIPKDMKMLIIPEDLYAVFVYRGIPDTAEPFFRYIYMEWLPSSGYVLDNRPHFEILGDKYKRNDPASEEEVWIPIKTKV